MSLKPHPEYKDSGANWLGAVPTSWSISPLGHFFTERSQTVSDKDFQPLSVTMQGIVPQMENVAKTENGDNRKLVRRGDFVINSRSDRKGSSGVADRDGSVSVISIVLEPHDIVPQFVHHLLRSKPFQEEFYRFGTGIVADLWSTRFSSMKSIRLAVPSVIEQNAIARYLDQETAEIDAFIADQEELIALLNERRAATITQAVTKGLDPNAPMKDSGVTRIGSVPIHWRVGRLKDSVSSAKNGVWGGDPDGGNLDIRCVRVADFDRPYLSIHDRNATRRRVPESDRAGRVLRKGDLLLEKSGGGEKSPVGFVVLYDSNEPAVCSNFVARIKLNVDMDSRYWNYVHSANYSTRLTQRSIKQVTGIQNLDQASYLSEIAVFPPYEAQKDIAIFLDRETAAIDATIADAKESIGLSRERRSALISAAVTGKIDVRDAVSDRNQMMEEDPVGAA